MAELEKMAVNDMFVVLSDVWLDNEEVGTAVSYLLIRLSIQIPLFHSSYASDILDLRLILGCWGAGEGKDFRGYFFEAL